MAASRGQFSMLFRPLNQLSRCRSLARPGALFYSSDNQNVSSSNPFYEKYASKIWKQTQDSDPSNVKRSAGFDQTDKSESKSYDDVLKKEVDSVIKLSRKMTDKKKISVGLNSQNGSPSLYRKKGLNAIMHLDKVEKESAESIIEIWREFHREKDCVSAVLPSSMYNTIQKRAQKYPVFLYPVPRENGYELMIGEFLNDQCYLTSVLNYQTLGENSPWVAAFTHFTELKESKGIVLMVGEIDTQYIATHEAMFIANLMQLYYGTDDENKLSLLKTFNTDPDKFDHMSVIHEMERSTIQTPPVNP